MSAQILVHPISASSLSAVRSIEIATGRSARIRNHKVELITKASLRKLTSSLCITLNPGTDPTPPTAA